LIPVTALDDGGNWLMMVVDVRRSALLGARPPGPFPAVDDDIFSVLERRFR